MGVRRLNTSYVPTLQPREASFYLVQWTRRLAVNRQNWWSPWNWTKSHSSVILHWRTSTPAADVSRCDGNRTILPKNWSVYNHDSESELGRGHMWTDARSVVLWPPWFGCAHLQSRKNSTWSTTSTKMAFSKSSSLMYMSSNSRNAGSPICIFSSFFLKTIVYVLVTAHTLVPVLPVPRPGDCLQRRALHMLWLRRKVRLWTQVEKGPRRCCKIKYPRSVSDSELFQESRACSLLFLVLRWLVMSHVLLSWCPPPPELVWVILVVRILASYTASL